MNETTLLGIVASGLIGKELAAVPADFLKRLFGPSADEIGQTAAGAIRAFKEKRAARATEVVSAAGQSLALSGRTAVQVPGRILWPILEHASLEEDDALRAKWAALLAAAADGARNELILPAFVDILRQLTPTEAAILDWVFSHKTSIIGSPGSRVQEAFDGNEIAMQFGLSDYKYKVLAADLHRLQVIDGRRHVIPRAGGGMSSASHYSEISLTDLGLAFLVACSSDPNEVGSE